MVFSTCFFLPGCQQLGWGNHLNINFCTKGRRVKAQLSFLLLAERDPIRGQKCYCWVGYNCFQWDNPHHFRAFKGSIRTCKYTVIQVFGVVPCFTLNWLLTFVYSQFPWHICSFQLKRLLSKRIRSWKQGTSDTENSSEQFLPTVMFVFFV